MLASLLTIGPILKTSTNKNSGSILSSANLNKN